MPEIKDNVEKSFLKINDTYEQEKGRNFILHLIRAFIKNPSVYPVLDFKDDGKKYKEPHKCCICETGLIDAGTVMEKLPKINIIKDIQDMLKGNKRPELEKFKESLEGKRRAVGSNDSNKLMCDCCIEALNSFVTNRILSGDSKVNWLIGKIVEKETGFNPNEMFKRR
jgi:hypothetical protein